MAKLVVTINQECCRCKTEIQKVLTCLQDEFCIEKIEIEKNSKVTITGKFDADKLKGRLQCKAGRFIKTIEKVVEKKVEGKKDDEKDKKKEPPCKLVHVYPWSYPPCPNPYQVPCGAYPSWQGSCSSCYPQQCQCYYYGKPPPPSPPAKPPSPCACAKCRGPSCSSGDDHCGGHGYCCGSSCSSKPETPSAPETTAPKPAPQPAPVPVPYPYPAPFIVCDDNNPSYACSVM